MNIAKQFIDFLVGFFNDRKMIYELSKNDFKSKYLTSMLGATWGFLQPLLTIGVFWVVFQLGFRNPPVNGVEFIIWFTPAFLIWSFFTEALMATTTSLREYTYLVKKINFKVSLIPLVKIFSTAIAHIALICFMFVLINLYDVGFSIYNLQIAYYFLATVVLLIGLGWLFSSLSPFLGDIPNLIAIVIQIGFWATPITWDPSTMAEPVLNILKYNPMYYICEGYRNTFVYHKWFWENMDGTIYYWCFTVIVFIIGAISFIKLKPHFSDVL